MPQGRNFKQNTFHIMSHQIKLSAKFGDWGHKALCGMKVGWAPKNPIKGKGCCQACLKSLMIKKEAELEELKGWFHAD